MTIKENKLINSDLNGSLNILKKVVGEFQYPIEVCSTPLVLTIKQILSLFDIKIYNYLGRTIKESLKNINGEKFPKK